MIKFVLEKPERFSWPLWIGALTAGALAISALVALGVVVVLILISFGLAVFLIAGLVNVIRQSLGSWKPGESVDGGGKGNGEEVLMEVEEIVTISSSSQRSQSPSAPESD